MFARRNTVDNFNVLTENRSNSFIFSLEDESNTIITNASIPIDVKNMSGNWNNGCSLYVILFNRIPVSMRKRMLGRPSFLDINVDIMPINRIIPKYVKNTSASMVHLSLMV